MTGHGWTIAAMHRRSLARFDFDSVLLPFNFFMADNERYRAAFDEVLADLPRAQRGRADHQVDRARAVGHRGPHPQHVVPAARGPAGHRPRRPLGRSALPDVFLNTAGDLTLLPRVLDAASRFERRPPDEAMAEMLGAARMTSLFGLPT